MKRIAWTLVAASLLAGAPSFASASTETSLAAAAAGGHSVFLVVTDGGTEGMDVVRRLVGEAQKLAPGTSVLEMNRADKTEAAVVKRYRLESVPVPLVLVIAANGVAAGGARPHLVTAARLAAMVPSPAKAAYLKSLEEKKATFLVFSRASMTNRKAALEAAEAAARTLKGAASVVAVDLDSEQEARFVAETKVDPKAKDVVVAVYNAKGQATETLVGVPAVESLVAAAKKEAECCPGGRCK
jgi:hypothetical protein